MVKAAIILFNTCFVMAFIIACWITVSAIVDTLRIDPMDLFAVCSIGLLVSAVGMSVAAIVERVNQ